MSDFDPKRSFLEMQQEREFWLYSLMEINNFKNHRLGIIWQAAYAGKVPARSFNNRTCRLIRCYTATACLAFNAHLKWFNLVNISQSSH